MTGRQGVDVLAVLDDIAENVRGIHHTSQRSGEAFGTDLCRARAIVAELIEADREFDAAEREYVNALPSGLGEPESLSDDHPCAIRLEAARTRRSAALRTAGAQQ